VSGTGVELLKGSEQFELAEEVPISPMPKLCGVSNQFIRCLSLRRGHALLTDIDLASRVVERRIEPLPLMHRLWFHPGGYSLGYRKCASIGNPSQLFFLDATGVLLESTLLPDAVSEVAPGPGSWYVGCRDSSLYAFQVDGQPLWRQRIQIPAPYLIPGVPAWDRAPCLHVGAGRGTVGVGAGRRMYLLDFFGDTQWEKDLRSERRTHEIVCGPSEVPTRTQLLERLGLPSDADRDRVLTGFVRLELRTGNGENSDWLAKVEKYEGLQGSNHDLAADPIAAVVQVLMAGSGPRDAICTVGVGERSIALGLMDGQVQLMDHEGRLETRYRVGDAPVSVIMDQRGLRASYSGGLLTLFDGERISGHVTLPQWSATVVPCGAEVMVWSDREAWVVNRKGRVVWRARFGRRIGGVAVHGGEFEVLAGRLFCFQRSPQESRSWGR
jgi:hypothetical protein